MMPFGEDPHGTRRHKGGGAAPSYATAALPPPPALNSVDVAQKEVLTRQQMLQRKGINSTILGSQAGMGAPPPPGQLGGGRGAAANALGQKLTLLGGG